MCLYYVCQVSFIRREHGFEAVVVAPGSQKLLYRGTIHRCKKTIRLK